MNEYLLAEPNRAAVEAHNANLVVTTTRKIGQAEFVSHDFNREEEYRELDAMLKAPNAESLTVRSIASDLYGSEDEPLVRRVRSMLRYNSAFQNKVLAAGTAALARGDGTLRIIHGPDEYGDLVEENIAVAVAGTGKYVERRTNRIKRELDTAVDRVPELAERLGTTREAAHAALGTVFTRKLELLAGD